MLRTLSRRAVSAVRSYHSPTTMDLSQVVSALKKFAPPSLAGSWDNVGLLIEPSPPHSVKRMLLTNDLTEPVLQEAIDQKVDMILSYHPPIFSPLKRLTQGKWKERVVVRCAENRIALYSPHTSYDALQGGVNDWLISCFKGEAKPIQTVKGSIPTVGKYKVEVSVPGGRADTCLQHLATLTDATITSKYTFEDAGGVSHLRIGLNANQSGLSKLIDYFNQLEDVKNTMEISELTVPIIPHHGAGRVCTLDAPMSLSAAVQVVKDHLKLPHVRLATAVGTDADPAILSVAVCAGSGSSVLGGVRADLYLTGEMSHHEVLDATHTGHSVILCDHSNTERGYLTVLKEQLGERLGEQVELLIAQTDADPLTVV